MVNKSIIGAACTCLAVVSFNVNAALIEKIENGGFESGDIAGWSEPSTNPNPWIVVSDNSHTGTYSAYNPALNSALASPTLFQSFAPTLVDNITSADFWYFHEGGSGTVGLATLLTFSDGTWVQDTLFAADPSYKQNIWTFRDLMPTLLENSGKHLVEIGFFPKSGGSQYVDDVSVSAVPIPLAVWLFGSGLLGLIGVARRKACT